MTRVVGVGAGGHAKVMLEALQAMGGYHVVGLLDADPRRWPSVVLGVPVLGDDRELRSLHAGGVREAFIAVGAAAQTGVRRQVCEAVQAQGFRIIAVRHPSAVMAPSARCGEGMTLLAGAIVSADAVLGDHVLINTGAIIEHDCAIGHYVHVASGATLCGAVSVGAGAFIGAGATVLPGISVGEGAVVGAGSVVTRPVAPGSLVVGVPAIARTRSTCAAPGSRREP